MITVPIDWPLVEDLVGTEPASERYSGGSRSQDELQSHRLCGAAGEYAVAAWLGETDAWIANRRALEHGYDAEIRSDLPGYLIDVKAKAARWDSPRLAWYSLWVEPHHLHREFRYVLAVVDSTVAHLTGWATFDDLSRSFDNLVRGGRLVHIVSGPRLRELPPAAEVRATWSIPS